MILTIDITMEGSSAAKDDSYYLGILFSNLGLPLTTSFFSHSLLLPFGLLL